jgi:hypothetical protein
MRSSKLDRTQLAPEFDLHLTDHAVIPVGGSADWCARGVGGAAARETKTQYRSADRLAGIRHMSRFLREYEFGASPLGAHVMRKHEIGEQTFYPTKILFPRGDAASLLFGFNSAGKVTGVSLMSMAGD